MSDRGDLGDRLAIKVDGLHEIFRVYHERPPGLKERLYRLRRASYTHFHALNGVDLEVRRGETLGLVGHNGSGKSTLLKCLAGILPADEGSVTVNGRVATMLELGAGFHEELSGRENVYLNGAILGLSRAEIDAAFDDIVDFAGVRRFIDSPVRNYSSGMYVRLGFAIAVHVDPDILLVDEVLSVGDQSFQEKSLERMRSFSGSGKTIVLVSHDLGSIRSLCDRVVVLHRGEIAFDGPAEDALDAYQRLMAEGPPPETLRDADGRIGDFRATITDLRLEVPARGLAASGGSGAPVGPVPAGSTVRVSARITARDDLVADGGLSVGVALRRPDVGPGVYETRTSWRGAYVAPPPPGESLTATFEFDLDVLTGAYLVDLVVANATTDVLHERWDSAFEIAVEGPGHDMGVAWLRARIRVHNPEGVWPPDSLPPPLEEGGPRHHPTRDGERRDGGGGQADADVAGLDLDAGGAEAHERR